MEESVREKERLLKMFKTNPEKYADYVSEHPFDASLVKMYNQQVNGRLNDLRERANKIRRMPGLSPKDRKSLLEPIKEEQNIIKRQITYNVNMIDEIESN
jgi:arsenate reductase-like glutaredoxin family protein